MLKGERPENEKQQTSQQQQRLPQTQKQQTFDMSKEVVSAKAALQAVINRLDYIEKDLKKQNDK